MNKYSLNTKQRPAHKAINKSIRVYIYTYGNGLLQAFICTPNKIFRCFVYFAHKVCLIQITCFTQFSWISTSLLSTACC